MGNWGIEVDGTRPVLDRDQQQADVLDAWAASGLMALTGRPEGPALGPPSRLVGGVRCFADEIARRSARLGTQVVADPLETMAEHAVLARLRRGGEVSCGGTSRLVRSADGWLAASLARASDWDLVAAWLELASPVRHGDWSVVVAEVANRFGAELTARSTLLGIPVAVVGERQSEDGTCAGSAGTHGIRMRRWRADAPVTAATELVVADLSALWAGPLVGALLHRAGARVVKIESATRADGARRGNPALYRSLNEGKASVVLDLESTGGRSLLRKMLATVDVVITAARPRALEQLGLDPEAIVRVGRPKVWLSISGYGSGAGSRDRVAFGDDAAAAGGLVAWDERGPCFCGDAIADPVTGLAATVGVLSALEEGGAWTIEASMADVAAGLAGPTVAVDGWRRSAVPAAATAPAGSASAPGADTAEVLTELGLG